MTALPFSILHEDNDLLVVNKESGIPVHRTEERGRNNLADLVAKYLGYSPTLFHRLDADTSGCILFGKAPEVNSSISEQFLKRQVEKLYHCVVDGRWSEQWTSVTSAIAKHRHEKGKWLNRPLSVLENASQKKQAKFAETHFRVLNSTGEKSLVEAKLVTGRTHQIRLHCLLKDHPILGDRLYGSRDRFGIPMALHAHSIKFQHPITRKTLHITAPKPDYWSEHWLDNL